MKERFKYTRSPDISQIGLSEIEMTQRGLLVVGYCREELLPPYIDTKHAKRSHEILCFSHTFPEAIYYETLGQVLGVNTQKEFQGKKVIQIVGGFADLCIPLSVNRITRQGQYAYIDSRYIFSDKTQTPYLLGQQTIRGIDKKIARCLIIGREQFIFYPD